MNTKPDPIKHVVLLMLENHSFDEMLGCFQDTYADLDGVRSGAPRYNLTLKGEKIAQVPKQNYFMRFDPRHEKAHVLEQIKDDNSGFVRDFAKAYPKSTKGDYAQLMGYYPMEFLPALHNKLISLTKEPFAVDCEHHHPTPSASGGRLSLAAARRRS